eukprot:jgi/Botrbrau1/15417/Bobra.43_2s0043.1
MEMKGFVRRRANAPRLETGRSPCVGPVRRFLLACKKVERLRNGVEKWSGVRGWPHPKQANHLGSQGGGQGIKGCLSCPISWILWASSNLHGLSLKFRDLQVQTNISIWPVICANRGSCCSSPRLVEGCSARDFSSAEPQIAVAASIMHLVPAPLGPEQRGRTWQVQGRDIVY